MIDRNEAEKALLERWRDYIPQDVSETRQHTTAKLLAAQNQYFSNLDDCFIEPIEAIVGENWRRRLLRGLGFAFAKSIAHDLFAIHPAAAPIWPIPKLVRFEPEKEPDREIPDYCWKVEMEPVTMNSRKLATFVTSKDIETEEKKLPTIVHPLPDPMIWGDLHAPITEFIFEEAILSCVHEALNKCLEATSVQDTFEDPDGVPGSGRPMADGIERARCGAYGASKLFPNVLVANIKHSIPVNGRQRVVTFPTFPSNKMLLLHKASSSLFGSVAWVPFVFQFYPANLLDPDDVSSIDPDTFEQGSLAMSIRHKFVITNPESLAVVRIAE